MHSECLKNLSFSAAAPLQYEYLKFNNSSNNIGLAKSSFILNLEDGGEICGSRVHFPSTPVKHLADLRIRANSQWYSRIYEDRRPKLEDTERSEGKKSA